MLLGVCWDMESEISTAFIFISVIKEVFWGGVFLHSTRGRYSVYRHPPTLRWQTEPRFSSLKKNKLEKSSDDFPMGASALSLWKRKHVGSGRWLRNRLRPPPGCKDTAAIFTTAKDLESPIYRLRRALHQRPAQKLHRLSHPRKMRSILGKVTRDSSRSFASSYCNRLGSGIFSSRIRHSRFAIVVGVFRLFFLHFATFERAILANRCNL